MNESIQKALKALEQANIAGYFEEMDKVEIPTHLKHSYAQFKGVFMHGQAPWDFAQKLETFAQAVNQAQNQDSKSDELDKKALKELFAEDEKVFFEKMEGLLSDEALDSLLQKKNRLKKIKKEFNDDFITREQYNTDFARIERYLFELIDDLK